jgi:hypothetical protein
VGKKWGGSKRESENPTIVRFLIGGEIVVGDEKFLGFFAVTVASWS